MPNETQEEIKEKLNYLGLNLEEVPEFLIQEKELEYKPPRSHEENAYKVYRFVDIRDITILITPSSRLDAIKEKYDKAESINSYINPMVEEDFLKHGIFLNMLKDMEIEEVEKIAKEQESYNKSVPFKVKYKDNYLWQIYYSEISKQYFMLVTTKDINNASFFYLLKKRIESARKKEASFIYVPISHSEYSGKFLKKSEISELENYLWLFTKEWPLVYETYDKEENMKLEIVGDTILYEQMRSIYKIQLESKEEAIEFYQLVKALFILQTELPENYHFYCQIDNKGGLEFFKEEEKIGTNNLRNFIKKHYERLYQEIENKREEEKQENIKLAELKELERERQKEFVEKEREIATFLECKKSLIGKLKYFFKHSKKKKANRKVNRKHVENPKENVLEEKQELFSYKKKEFYTLEELITIHVDVNLLQQKIKNARADREALEQKLKMLQKKIENATQYMEEIDEHQKSLFEFWKYTSKDDKLALNPAETTEEEKDLFHLEKVFHYIEDKEEIGIKMDKLQREELSEEEKDCVFLLDSTLIEVINERNKTQESEFIEKSLQEYKNKMEEMQKQGKKDFNIFGAVAQKEGIVKEIAGKKHREVEKEFWDVLDITSYTTEEEWKEGLEEINEKVKEAIEKIQTPVTMFLYSTEEKEGYQVLHIDPEMALKEKEEEGEKKVAKEIILNQYELKKEMPAVFYTNNIYYDNYNKTLPIGMDLSDKVLINLEKKKTGSQKIRRNYEVNEKEVITQTLCINRFELQEKKQP